MPSASVRAATAVKAGALRSERTPYRRSWTRLSILRLTANAVPMASVRACALPCPAAGSSVPDSDRPGCFCFCGFATPEPMSFWSEMSKGERSTFRACFGGWALDGMDFQFYSFIIPSLIAGWHLTRAQAGTLQTTTLLLSAVGGWLAGLVADRIGRVRTLQITILWFAVFT